MYMLCAFDKGYKLRMRAARFVFTLLLSLFLSLSLSGALLPLTRRQTLLFLLKSIISSSQKVLHSI